MNSSLFPIDIHISFFYFIIYLYLSYKTNHIFGVVCLISLFIKHKAKVHTQICISKFKYIFSKIMIKGNVFEIMHNAVKVTHHEKGERK